MAVRSIVKHVMLAIAMAVAFLVMTAEGLEVTMGTGQILMPNADGSLSGTHVGSSASIFLCLSDASVYDTYSGNPHGLYELWLDGGFSSSAYKWEGTTSSSGRADASFDVSVASYFYAISIATLDSAEFGKTFFIASANKKAYTGDDPDFDTVDFFRTIADAGNWNVTPEPTTASLCLVGLAVLALRRGKKSRNLP